MVSKDQIVGIDWSRITRLHSNMLPNVNSLTAACRHIKAYRDVSNQPPEYTNREITYYVNSRRNVDQQHTVVKQSNIVLQFIRKSLKK